MYHIRHLQTTGIIFYRNYLSQTFKNNRNYYILQFKDPDPQLTRQGGHGEAYAVGRWHRVGVECPEGVEHEHHELVEVGGQVPPLHHHSHITARLVLQPSLVIVLWRERESVRRSRKNLLLWMLFVKRKKDLKNLLLWMLFVKLLWMLFVKRKKDLKNLLLWMLFEKFKEKELDYIFLGYEDGAIKFV